MKITAKLTFGIFTILILSTFYLINVSYSKAQSPIRCGLNGEACCNLAGSPPDSCQKGLACQNNVCVPDGSGGTPPTRGLVTGDPIPGFKVPCYKEEDPEFHSLRPYQASPCGDAPKAVFCNNDYIIEEKVKTTWNSTCTQSEPFICTTNQTISRNYVVDGENAELPILGNTEDVKNSAKDSDSIDDATKVNEYVSWYLNGVNNRAEYGSSKNTAYETVNLSGPIQKLFPKAIQEAQRIQSIKNASITTSYTTDDGQGVENEPENHNQIVVCAEKGIFGIGKAKPHDCYAGGGSQAKDEYRLNMWIDKTLPELIKEKLFEYISLILPDTNLVTYIIDHAFFDRWEEKIPPLPWADEKGKPFASNTLYQKAYNEWRGDLCVLIPLPFTLPIFGNQLLLCIGIPGITNNEFADLFPYIPLANTVDKNALHLGQGVGVRASGQTEAEIKTGKDGYAFKTQPTLFYPHSQEVFDLTNFLNSAHAPKKDASATDSVSETSDFENNQCQIIDVRSNPGDQLFPSSKDGRDNDLTVTNVNIHVTKIQCDPAPIRKYIAECENGPATSPICASDPPCNGVIYVEIRTTPKIPYGNEIWQNTVVGENSAFRRIFPKVGVGSPVECIADIPGVSTIDYKPDSKTNLIAVDGPTGRQKPDETKLYFPHLGTVYDYFLKGIQTALRPKGYGEPLTNGTQCSTTSGTGDCSFDMNKINSAISKASAKYNVPVSLLRSIFEIESYEYIADPSSYICEENFAGAAGVAQIVKKDNSPSDSTYHAVTCEDERIANDIPMCGDYDPKLSRCSIDDAFELMARILLYKAGRWNSSSCIPAGSISESEKMVWYDASCNYYGSHSPDELTINLSQDIPETSRRTDGDMNYCDIVCYKMGQCPPYPPPSQ